MEIVGTEVPRDAEGKAKSKPLGQWIGRGLVDYDPERHDLPSPKATDAHPFDIKTEEYVKRFALRKAVLEGVVPQVDAVMQTPTIFREGGKWRWRLKPTVIRGSVALFQEYCEASPMKWALESNGNPFDTGDTTFSGTTSATSLIDANEFIPFLNGPFYKQLYQYDYLSMHARAFELTNHNALAAGAVKILTRFVIGRGISFTIKDPACKQVWDEFWERNKMREKARQMARDITWQGELFHHFVEKVDGFVTMRMWDPSTVWEIVTDPEDFDHVYYAHRQFPTPYQLWTSGSIPISKYIIQQIPPTQFQHIKINVSSQEKRGRSDLLPAMPWLKRFNDYYNGTVVKAMLEANLVYIVKVHGDQNDVNTIAADPNFTTLPPPGGMWIENEAVELKPISAQLTAGRGSSGIGQQLAAIIATSLNLPSEYFNIESGGAARATALVRTDPAVKTIEDRQQTLKETLEDIYDRVIEAAIRAGRLSPEKARHEPEQRSEPGELAPDDAPEPEPVQSEFVQPVPVRAVFRG